eukprot:CAMPEP_0178954216 /NCGR_PEP_ID=MMETSP0789-20121207/8863_1 /TAXON_ID=3005 /ORGANISM="Rhizosolenia setigera, Strain CCMP 1694" /LENGTH=192 /DNA_ID=CAMNT_0020635585 /DNA_START=22 /DNA_END=600 /DNA_ORIENTATION=+
MSKFLGKAQDLVTKAVFGSEKVTMKETFYELVDKCYVKDELKEVSMSNSKEVFFASSTWHQNEALTKQNYTEFSQIIDELGPKGLKVLAFPCNQFGAQEPGTHEQILEFVESKFSAADKFTWFEKGHVNGKDTREVYSFLKSKLPADDGTTDIRWNFAKFLVDHEGNPYKRFGPKTSPMSMKSDIEELLAKM